MLYPRPQPDRGGWRHDPTPAARFDRHHSLLRIEQMATFMRVERNDKACRIVFHQPCHLERGILVTAEVDAFRFGVVDFESHGRLSLLITRMSFI